MSRIILLRHSTSFYCHCMAILLPFYLCCMTCPKLMWNSISGLVHCVVQWYKQVWKYWTTVWSLIPRSHSVRTTCTAMHSVHHKFWNSRQTRIVSRALSRGRNVNFFCFECQFKRQAPAVSVSPPLSLLSCCVFVAAVFASSDKVRPLVLWQLQIMDTEPINTTGGAPQKVRLLVWGRKLLQHVTV